MDINLMDINELYRYIGSKIREARENASLSQAALAKSLDMSRASIVNIEAGRQRPPVHVLWQISEKVGTKVSQLIPNQPDSKGSSMPSTLDPQIYERLIEISNDNSFSENALIEAVLKFHKKIGKS
jgi:transcriptional regulator with XRE-family HTH domain